MVRSTFRIAVTGGAMAVVAGVLGCESSSHKSVRMYEYDESPQEETRPREDESQWEMVSPGEMVAPGEMVPPDQADEDD